MSTLIVVPARFDSVRFPGKPLALINGISMVRRTAQAAQKAAAQIEDCNYVVATDNDDIKTHCIKHGIPAIMTPQDLTTGSDRAFAAAKAFAPTLDYTAEYIVNLQGDAPFTPINQIVAVAKALKKGADVATPYIQLTWDALDHLRAHKLKTPFSGTSVIVSADNKAIWFSKNIIPAIRKETALRKTIELSPICRHVGLYAYTRGALEKFVNWPESQFENLEGLEQLRLLENGLTIECVRVDPPKIATPGIDTPEDLELAEALIAAHGDPFT